MFPSAAQRKAESRHHNNDVNVTTAGTNSRGKTKARENHSISVNHEDHSIIIRTRMIASCPKQNNEVIRMVLTRSRGLAHLVSAGFAGLLEVGIEACVTVATAVLLADLWQLLHPWPSCRPYQPVHNCCHNHYHQCNTPQLNSSSGRSAAE